MRNRMVSVMHLNRERRRLTVAVEKDPDNRDLLKAKTEVLDKMLDLIVDEMADMSRDIQSVQSRPRFR